jgi:hypothetical protein
MRRNAIVATAAFVAIASAPASGQDVRNEREWAVDIGYSHLFLDGSNAGPLEEQGGLRGHGRVSWPVNRQRPNLRVGVGLSLTSYVSEDGGEFEDDDDHDGWYFYVPDDWNHLFIIEPELQASWRHPIKENLYLEPGVAASMLVGNFVRGEESFGFVDEDIDRWDVGAAGRVFLRGALTSGRWSFGLEGSYSFGWLSFGDDIGGDIQRGHLGFFFARSF